jgi:hypothetical protein
MMEDKMIDEKTIIQWLRCYRTIPKRINDLKDAKCALEEMRRSGVSISISNPEIAPVKNGVHSDPTYQAVIKLCKEYDNDIARIILKMDSLRMIRLYVDEIMEWLYQNDDHALKVYYELIRLRYFEALNMSKISKLFLKDMKGKYKESSLFRMHNNTIALICQNWEHIGVRQKETI